MLKILKPAIVLFIVSSIVTGLLAVTYSATKDIIFQRQQEALMAARERALSAAVVFEEMEKGSYLDDPDISSIYIGKDSNGSIIGLVISLEPRGYANVIKMSVGIRIDGTIEAVEIIEHEETPGLGARITENEFIDQFSEVRSDNKLSTVTTAPEEDTQIQALSGATVSSRTVVDGVNKAKQISAEVFEKAGGSN